MIENEVAAKLKLGIDPRKKKTTKQRMRFDEFRQNYYELKQFRSERAKSSTENRLDVCERLMNITWLDDALEPSRLAELQAKILAGGRSPHTVRSYQATLTAALNCAFKMGYAKSKVEFELISTTKLSGMKGQKIEWG